MFLALMVLATACGLSDDNQKLMIFTHTFDFNVSEHGWQYGFAEFPANTEDSVRLNLQYAYTEQPSEIDARKKAIMLSGDNYCKDLFMYIKKKITGLKPSVDYTITFEVEFASNAGKDAAGPDGSPGQQVYLKAGASAIEPKSVIEQNYYVMNIDKGDRNEHGEDMIWIGNIGLETNTGGNYALISRSNASSYENPFVVKSNSKGELWLIVGTDSDYKGPTTIYYTKISAVFSALQ